MNVIDFAKNTAKLSGRITVYEIIRLIFRHMPQCNCVGIFFLAFQIQNLTFTCYFYYFYFVKKGGCFK